MFTKIKETMQGMLKSWTVHVNTYIAIFVLSLPELTSALPDLQSYLPDNMYKFVALGLVVVNLLLRLKTKTALVNK